jgi:hypothetical protein
MNKDKIKEIKEAAKRYKEKYGPLLLKNKMGAIGVGDNCIHIYVENNNELNKLPTTFESFNVEITVIGKITAY